MLGILVISTIKSQRVGKEFKYLVEFRRMFDVQSGASHVIRDQSGKSMKLSIIHTWNLSTRDSPVFPTRGHLIKISNELAGIDGDARFFKSELTLQNNWTKNIFTLTINRTKNIHYHK
jgi:outer membrane protein assembly factor BamA